MTGLASLARLLADDTRAAICLALLDGRAWTAKELADAVRVAPSTATEHLNRLVDGGLLTQEHQGRHRYLRLAGPEVSSLVEDLQAASGPPARPPSSLRAVRAARDLAEARTCYDHLAGRLGVAVTDALADRGWLELADGCALTPSGRAGLREVFDVDLGPASARRTRPVVRTCLDWTERRPHLAGAAGAGLLSSLVGRGWLTRTAGSRAVRLTPAGEAGLRDTLGVEGR